MTIELCRKYDNISITIYGLVDSIEKGKRVIEKLNQELFKNVHIVFLDSSIIPSNLVEVIYKLKEENRCKVFVSKRYLYSYLLGLGIKCSLKTEKIYFVNQKKVLNRESLSALKVKDFLEEIYNIYGYDYSGYQIESIMRRINIAMLREGIEDFNYFRDLVLKNSNSFEQLFLDLSINTTEFFRDGEVFFTIKKKVLPYLNSYPHIKIWCAGCSTGKEPYSLAILLKEFGILNKTQIYATDINPYVIDEAKNGLYNMNTVDKDIQNYRKAGGENNFIEYFNLNKGYMGIKDEFKKNILFFQHSLIEKGIVNEFQLILCRNVLIYFDNDLQNKVLKSFYNSLDTSGFLILGKSEGMLKNNGINYFNKFDESNKIYKKQN